MFDNINHKRNVNQHHNEMPPYTCKNSYYQKKKITNTNKDAENGGLSYIVGGNVNQYSHMENITATKHVRTVFICEGRREEYWRLLKKLEIEFPYVLVISLLSTLKEMRSVH